MPPLRRSGPTGSARAPERPFPAPKVSTASALPRRVRAARSSRLPNPQISAVLGRPFREVRAAPGAAHRDISPVRVRIPVKPITRSGGKPITCSGANRSPVPTQTDHLSERSDAGRNHESRFSVRVDGRLRFRIESPFRSSLYALCTRRSRIALASVGSPMTSCHLRLPPISRTG